VAASMALTWTNALEQGSRGCDRSVVVLDDGSSGASDCCHDTRPQRQMILSAVSIGGTPPPIRSPARRAWRVCQVRVSHRSGLRSRERGFESCLGYSSEAQFEHSGNLGRAEARAPDLRRCGRAPELVPDACPESAAMNKSLLLRPTGIHGLRAVRSHKAVAPAPTLRLCGASGHDPPPAKTGQAPGRQAEVAPSAFFATSCADELDMVICRASHPRM
jgi:hypothetical protein